LAIIEEMTGKGAPSWPYPVNYGKENELSADVLVVGGGTSGATAAITSAREGMSTVLLELNPGLGGTGTLGGVDSYWFGRRVSLCTPARGGNKGVTKREGRRGEGEGN